MNKLKIRGFWIGTLIRISCLSLLFLALACDDGDSYKIHSSNNFGADTSGGGLNISAASADGTQTVNINSGNIDIHSEGQFGRAFSYETSAPGFHTFCLLADFPPTLEVITAEGEMALRLEQSACAEAELPAGSHTMILKAAI